MLRRQSVLLALLATGFVGVAMADQPASGPGLTDAEYASALAAIRPAPGEDRYTRIPWLTSLWDARRQASAEGKPILLWEMDGHPLGCG